MSQISLHKDFVFHLPLHIAPLDYSDLEHLALDEYNVYFGRALQLLASLEYLQNKDSVLSRQLLNLDILILYSNTILCKNP